MGDKRDSPSQDRIILIDLARGLSIVLVLAAHLAFARSQSGLDKPLASAGVSAWSKVHANGGFGVCLFFVLSGFLISRVLMQSCSNVRCNIPMREFYARRAGRIFPLLALVCLIGAFALTNGSLRSMQFQVCYGGRMTTAAWLSIAAFIFNWYRIFHFKFGIHFGVLWSLSIEEQFYVGYPWLLKRSRSLRQVAGWLICFIILGPVSRWLAYLISPDNYFLSLTNSFGAFDQIALGCLLYFTVGRTQDYFKKHRWVAAACLLVGVTLLFQTYVKANSYYGPDRIYAPSLLALGLFLALLGGLTFKIQETKFIKLACLPGQLSYGLYLLHATVLFFTWNALMTPGPWCAWILYVAFNTVLGYFTFHFYEKPANYFVRRQFTRLLNLADLQQFRDFQP